MAQAPCQMEEATYILPLSLCDTKRFKKVQKMEDYFRQSYGKTYSKSIARN
jgi:hypothetical protein